SYNLKAVVFRMSCIYGPRQFGTEDQGWVAHFLIQAIKDQPIHIYGNGKQVRDILYVGDLLKAFQLAWDNMESISGEAFNIGGGGKNAISLLELINLVEIKIKRKIDLKFGKLRSGDQAYYVSDTKKFNTATGWAPSVSIEKGLDQLFQWLQTQHRPYKNGKNLSDKVLNEYISTSTRIKTGEN